MDELLKSNFDGCVVAVSLSGINSQNTFTKPFLHDL